jgi:hypothetical protein
MKGRRLLALSVLTIALACQDQSPPTGPKTPGGPAGLISDGAHGGNPDFFFLPPMVPNPVNDPNYEAGKFNGSLASRLAVEICLLDKSPLDTQGNPAACVGPLVKKFGAGEVQLQDGTDGHYQVLWKTRESNLDLTSYYRIQVLIEGSEAVFGLADVDPMENKSQLKNARTGEVIALIDDSTLPIKFRIENGGGPTLCGGATLCGSGTITNTTPNGEPQFVRVPASDGSFVAGVLIPSGFLPLDGPQTVVLTIAGVNTGANDPSTGTQATPCHLNLPLQQFNSCFHFRTIPELDVIEGSEEGHQFLKPITVAVCFVLHDAEPRDPREDWVQLWSSDPDEEGGDTKPLPSAPVSQILSGPSGENCGDVLVAVNDDSNGLTRFASAGWQKVKSGLNRVFGVQTAYAVDLGIGGLAFDLSNIGPALTARIQRYTDTDLTLGPGATTTSTARIVGTRVHNGGPLSTGIGGLPVTFTVAAGNGSLRLIGSELPPASVLTSITNTNPINPESPTSGGGFAPVNWTMPTPTAPGTYHYTLEADGPALGGPVTFTATVTVAALLPDLVASSGTVGAPVLSPSDVLGTGGGSVSISPWKITNQGGGYELEGSVNAGIYLSPDPIITASDTRLAGRSIGSALGAGASFNAPGESLSIPERQAGLYYIGVLADEQNVVDESNEENNYVTTPLLISDVIDFENYPNENAACDGAASCDVTDEFAGRGVVFSFDQIVSGESNASLCSKPFNPIGETPNYGVSPHAISGCSSWNGGTVTMSFGSHPRGVEFQLQGNNTLAAGPFPVTALDANGNAVLVTREVTLTYSPSAGLTFRREIRRAISEVGIASVSVISNAGVIFIDNLQIAP